MPDGGTKTYLTRESATEWFARAGITHITIEYLAKRQALGSGPEQVRIGKYVYYEPSALQAWLDLEIRRGHQPRRKRA